MGVSEMAWFSSVICGGIRATYIFENPVGSKLAAIAQVKGFCKLRITWNLETGNFGTAKMLPDACPNNAHTMPETRLGL